MIVVARGGGSLADLFAFCDETLCRTVALLRVPVISSVGHHTDRTLLDDVAAVACSTPTHAAETAVPVDCARGPRRARGHRRAGCERQGRRAVLERARTLARLSRAPAPPRRAPPRAPAPAPARAARRDPPRDRRPASATTRSRAVGARAQGDGGRGRAADAPRAAPARTPRRWTARRPRRSSAAAATWTASSATLAAHDPQRTLERGYALRRGPGRRAGHERRGARASCRALTIRLHDGRVTRLGGGATRASTAPRRTSGCSTRHARSTVMSTRRLDADAARLAARSGSVRVVDGRRDDAGAAVRQQ